MKPYVTLQQSLGDTCWVWKLIAGNGKVIGRSETIWWNKRLAVSAAKRVAAILGLTFK